jgi:hypothetical protein
MHMRRVLLLFAIVLGLAALAASVSRPLEERRGATTTEPVPQEPRPRSQARQPARLAFTAGPPRERRRLEPGRAAVVLVSTDESGQVALEGLGLSASAEPLTPARFDVLTDEPVTARVTFTPAGSAVAQTVGTLDVSERGSARSGERSATRTERDR